MIDAEMGHMQAAANHLVLALQYKYNRIVPLVYNTYQCYRKVGAVTIGLYHIRLQLSADQSTNMVKHG